MYLSATGPDPCGAMRDICGADNLPQQMCFRSCRGTEHLELLACCFTQEFSAEV